MDFLSISYAIFLLTFLGVYWTVSVTKFRFWLILLASLVFYAAFLTEASPNAVTSQLRYIPLLLVVVFINYQLGRELGAKPLKSTKSKGLKGEKKVEKSVYPSCPIDLGNFDDVGGRLSEDLELAQASWNPRRLAILWFGIVFNVALLVGFKYVAFLLDTVGQLFSLGPVQQNANWFRENVFAPLGISFFCFECVAYLIDVYRGAPASQHFIDFAAYKFFFPKLLSGPITRYHTLINQLKSLQLPMAEEVTDGLWLIACGAVKKGLIADRLGILVDLSFSNLQRAGSGDIWLATIAYGLQLFLDFSGYVDIARGSAMLMGLKLPENFDFPYFTTSIADFWRRWHITLGDWLRNYLYFPLGGSRKGLDRTCLNLLIIMLIAGIWHGAAWGFVVWGLIHGVGLVVHRLNEAVSNQVSFLKGWWQSLPGILMAWLLTQGLVFGSWLWFRLPDLKDSSWAFLHLLNHRADAQFAQKVYFDNFGMDRLQISMILASIAAAMTVSFVINRGLKLELNWPLKMLLVPVCFFVVWLLAPQGTPAFIYFDF